MAAISITVRAMATVRVMSRSRINLRQGLELS